MQLTKLISGIKKILFFSLIMAIWCSVGLAAEHYASPTGTASWANSTNINTPCSASTAMQEAEAGDIVYFRGGTYYNPVVTLESCNNRFFLGLMPINSGTSGNPITFKAYQDEVPFIDNSANDGACNVIASFGVRYQDYITFDGFHSKAVMSGDQAGLGGRGWAAQFFGTTGSVIRNCTLEAIDGARSNNSAVRVEDSNNSTVENNILFGAHQSGGPHHNSAAFMLYDSNHIIIKNNTIYDSDCAMFDKQGGTYNTYSYNFIYGCEWGFQHTSIGPPTGNLEIYNNIFINIESWAYANAGGDSESANDILFYNNTMYNNSGTKISSNDSSATDVTGFECFNNINYRVDTAVTFQTSEVDIINHNLYFLSSGLPSSPWDANSSTSNPNFVNVGGSLPEDYKRTSYPTEGRGDPYASVMGAYITGNEVIGYSSDGEKPPPPYIEKPQEFQREPSQ